MRKPPSLPAPCELPCFPNVTMDIIFAQESVEIQMAAITNENVYTTQAMEALLFFRVDSELVAGAEQALDDSSNLLPLHVSCQRHF